MEENCPLRQTVLFHNVYPEDCDNNMEEEYLMEETLLFHVVQPEDCDNTHETISSYNVFAVYSFTIY